MPVNESQRIAELVGIIESQKAQLDAALDAKAKSEERVESLMHQVEQLTLQIAVLATRIGELTARLNTDSSNSSKPPSKDGPSAKRSLRQPSGKRPGGQPGHKGSTLAMVATPDATTVYSPSACNGCGHCFTEADKVTKVERRQVHDLPTALKLVVTEHQIQTRRCGGCGQTSKADGPAHVLAPVQYGPNVSALITYLVMSKHLSTERAADLLTDLFAAPISTGTITTILTKTAVLVDIHFKPVAKEALKQEPIAHADETTLKVAGGKRWVHSFSSSNWTWIETAKKRGREAMEKIGILPDFDGTLVTDALASYDIYGRDHQLCCAHLLRELNAVHQHHQHTNGGWCWAEQVANALRTIIHDPTQLAEQKRFIRSALAIANTDDPDQQGTLGNKSRTLRNRITTRLSDYLRFTEVIGLPPTNNPAEQEIRMVKVKQNNAGCMRTEEGANGFLAIRSYLSTAAKHAIRPLEALASLSSANPWLPATT